jgi:hypothetical protein
MSICMQMWINYGNTLDHQHESLSCLCLTRATQQHPLRPTRVTHVVRVKQSHFAYWVREPRKRLCVVPENHQRLGASNLHLYIWKRTFMWVLRGPFDGQESGALNFQGVVDTPRLQRGLFLINCFWLTDIHAHTRAS